MNGKNFIDMGFGKVKCIFNNTHIMNATIMEQDIIKCDSPELPNNLGFSDFSAGQLFSDFNGAPFYNVSITLNGKEISGNAKIKFYYYVNPSIASVTPNIGPMKGGTLSRLWGYGFA